MAIKVRQLCDDTYEIESATRINNITTDELNAVLEYLSPTIECSFKGRSCKHVIIDRYGVNDYGAWFTDDPTDDMSGCSVRGSLKDIIRDVRDELPQKRMTNSDRLETIAQFIDIFDDFLDENGINIENPERDDDPCASNIYGTDYGILSDRIESLLIRLGYMKKED